MKEKPKIPQYSYYIGWSLEDKEFVATFLELPELSGLGSTIREAIYELREALIGWIETAKEQKFDLPKPLQENAPAPLVVLDRSLLGRDPILVSLPQVLPEEISQKDEPAVEKMEYSVTGGVKAGELVINSPTFNVTLG